jgi:predicted RNA-binding Zn-ribbon protein involved in translation (DUF1610 family)
MPIVVKCPSCGKRLKAPSSSAGKVAKCPGCGTKIRIPEEILDAEPVPLAADAPSESADDDLLAGLNSLSARDYGETLPKRKSCPACGEEIVATAAKCRYCGEIFDSKLKKKAKTKARTSQDDDLTAVDWIACLLCSGITCILSIVYMIQGKKKGLKMFGISIAATVFWTIVQMVLQIAMVAARRPR